MLHSNSLQHLPDAVFKDMKSLQVNVKSRYNVVNRNANVEDFVATAFSGGLTFCCCSDKRYLLLLPSLHFKQLTAVSIKTISEFVLPNQTKWCWFSEINKC